jgi:hypothetical protein
MCSKPTKYPAAELENMAVRACGAVLVGNCRAKQRQTTNTYVTCAIVSVHSSRKGAGKPMPDTSPSEFTPLVVKPKVAWKMLSCSNTRGYELLAAGELDSFLDGRSRKITVESIRRYIAQRLCR